jgi:hypothetical protein
METLLLKAIDFAFKNFQIKKVFERDSNALVRCLVLEIEHNIEMIELAKRCDGIQQTACAVSSLIETPLIESIFTSSNVYKDMGQVLSKVKVSLDSETEDSTPEEVSGLEVLQRIAGRVKALKKIGANFALFPEARVRLLVRLNNLAKLLEAVRRSMKNSDRYA